MTEILDVVNERDEVTGQMERAELHRQGLIYRSVHVQFYTPAGDIILQRRSMSKATYPGCLTTTVSGHVESGMTYYDTALKETHEETGIVIDPTKLSDLGKVYFEHPHHEGTRGNAMKGLYAYLYNGALDQLQIEAGEADGFEVFTFDEFRKAVKTDPSDFVMLLSMKPGQEMIDKIEKLYVN